MFHSKDLKVYTLDKYMAQIPDEPQICGYTASRRADNNSILEMKKYASSVAGFVVFQSQSYRGGELHNQQAWSVDFELLQK